LTVVPLCSPQSDVEVPSKGQFLRATLSSTALSWVIAHPQAAWMLSVEKSSSDLTPYLIWTHEIP